MFDHNVDQVFLSSLFDKELFGLIAYLRTNIEDFGQVVELLGCIFMFVF